MDMTSLTPLSSFSLLELFVSLELLTGSFSLSFEEEQEKVNAKASVNTCRECGFIEIAIHIICKR